MFGLLSSTPQVVTFLVNISHQRQRDGLDWLCKPCIFLSSSVSKVERVFKRSETMSRLLVVLNLRTAPTRAARFLGVLALSNNLKVNRTLQLFIANVPLIL
jgi:hypothetical protein